ncbi:MAG: cell division protein ZapA [Albidovulum sp.]|nr:cell division protein ZapA [Albidovulum sp.]
MPEIAVQVGGRDYNLICDEHEIAATKAASEYLDHEIAAIRVKNPNSSLQQLHFMSAIILADKLIGLESEMAQVKEILANMEKVAEDYKSRSDDLPISEALEAFAERAEELADRLELALAPNSSR